MDGAGSDPKVPSRAPSAGDPGAAGRTGNGEESHKDRVNRELIELLNELRVALPGVQVLFAFLLTVPFSQGFAKLTDPQRAVFFGTFVTTFVASTFLIAPTAYHRLRFRVGDKERMLGTANRFAIAGLVLLAVALGGAMFLVADVVYEAGLAAGVAGAAVAALAWCWFVLPLTRKVDET
jgi:Family of unknown function (DUF6328)